MDGTTILLVIGGVEIAVLVVLWIRVRAFEALVSEEMSVRVDATRQAIDTLQERLSPVGNSDVEVADRRTRRRGRKARRKRS